MYVSKEINEEYAKKLVTADSAAEVVNNGNRISYGAGLSCPYDFDKALAARIEELSDLEIVYTQLIQNKPLPSFEASESAAQVKYASAHFNGYDRIMSRDGRCWFIPMLFSDLPYCWKNIDVLVIQTGPMDPFGNFNIGPQVSDLRGAIEAAKTVIVEVNENMPRAHGFRTELSIHDVDMVIEGSSPLLPIIPTKSYTDIDKKIAENVVSLIRNGSTLQFGIGSLPNAIGSIIAQSDLKDLSGHTELLGDAFVDLYNAGKLTNNKNRNQGKLMYSFAGGTQKLYDFIDDNPICCNAPVNWVNSHKLIASIDNFVSITSCVNVDLYGQVSSESAGYRQISGTGGQLDFVLGASASKGGKSIICTHSTRLAEDGTIESLIRPTFKEGSIVTIPRAAVQYIVTEYGAANLKGKSAWERSESLIKLAHPDFRDELIEKANKMGIWTKTSKITF